MKLSRAHIIHEMKLTKKSRTKINQFEILLIRI